jgi:hypothetical protein
MLHTLFFIQVTNPHSPHHGFMFYNHVLQALEASDDAVVLQFIKPFFKNLSFPLTEDESARLNAVVDKWYQRAWESVRGTEFSIKG